MIKDKIEAQYYPEISKELIKQIKANLPENKNIDVLSLVGEIRSGLLTMISNGYDAGDLLKDYSQNVHRLYLDISILLENKENGKFDIVIFEIKKVKKMGLSELSQLIGYCLVSKVKFGVLVNVDTAISHNLSIMLDDDPDLTHITRFIDGKKINHELGVMVWNSFTMKIEYTNSGAIKSMPHLVAKLTDSLS